MTGLQEFRENLLFGEEPSDHERSILLVDIMNALGFSKNEREIHRHDVHLNNALMHIFNPTAKITITMAGSNSEGLCGGIYGEQTRHDSDCLLTGRNIKLSSPCTNNINHPPLLLLDDNEDYDVCCFVEEDDNFPGYVKLSLAEVKRNCAHCTRIYDDKQYVPNSFVMGGVQAILANPMTHSIPLEFDRSLNQQININGPAQTVHNDEYRGLSETIDHVYCVHYDMWPNAANSFITRYKPNNWPSNSMVKHILSQGCDVAPVGHHDSKYNDIQWRISFPGERSLLIDLTDVQILCYALIKIILKENLNTSQREVVSSFHIKHVLFWCVERSSCRWVYSNYITCLNICLAQLTEMIKARHIPHYIIESRNLFNSKMTEKLSTEIVDVLSKYDTTHACTLDAFGGIFKLTDYNNALLKRTALISTIMACFNAYFQIFSSLALYPSLFWISYIPHNPTKSLLNYVNIQQNLKKEKGASIEFSKYLVRSMLGFLYYAKYKESNKMDLLLESKRLIQKSLNLDNSCVKLRAATFFLTNLEYSQAINICDTLLTFPPRHQVQVAFGVESSSYIYAKDKILRLRQQLSKVKTTDEIENIKTEILPMFYTSVKLKSLSGNYDITQENPVLIFRNFTNIFFHDVYTDVTFMTAEQWVVPDPIQYELLSLQQNADGEVFPISGIHLDPMFVCPQTKFLCYHSMGNAHGMAEMLTLMNNFISEDTFTTQSSYVYLNMLAYCQIKVGQHRQSVKSILLSLRIFPSRYNTALGYLKIVLQILNSLSI
jgi:hypothetical protein